MACSWRRRAFRHPSNGRLDDDRVVPRNDRDPLTATRSPAVAPAQTSARVPVRPGAYASLMADPDLHPFLLDGAWRCALCGGRVAETSRRYIGLITRPDHLRVFRVFGTCSDCSQAADWTETSAPHGQ